jgi:hypothetical protein
VAPHAHVAVLVRRLAGPTKNVVEQVSLAAGPTPSVCAVWTRELRCYRSGAVKGRVVSRNPGYGVGIRSDGGAVAWTESEANQLLVIADLNGDVTTVRMRERFAKGAPADAGIPESLDDLHWLAPRTLVATSNGDSDEGRGLCVIDLDHPREQEGDGAGLGRCLQPRGAQASLGYAHFEEAALVEPGVVVAVERAPGCCVENPNQPAGRAVRLRLSDGAVLGVFATARAGRDVTDVSGGPRAVLYRPGRKARTSPSRCAGRVTRMAPR